MKRTFKFRFLCSDLKSADLTPSAAESEGLHLDLNPRLWSWPWDIQWPWDIVQATWGDLEIVTLSPWPVEGTQNKYWRNEHRFEGDDAARRQRNDNTPLSPWEHFSEWTGVEKQVEQLQGSTLQLHGRGERCRGSSQTWVQRPLKAGGPESHLHLFQSVFSHTCHTVSLFSLGTQGPSPKRIGRHDPSNGSPSLAQSASPASRPTTPCP